MNRQAVQTLKTYFGYDTFREGQESVVESILEHRDGLSVSGGDDLRSGTRIARRCLVLCKMPHFS